MLAGKTLQDYERIFTKERESQYPMIDAVEEAAGFALDQDSLLKAARALACPVKVNPPNWQHGRVLYAVARQYFASQQNRSPAYCLLDVGTAKGFSALCLQWAAKDAGVVARVHSVDVVDPRDKVWRNTVLECERDQPMTLAETLLDWPEALDIRFHCASAVQWLRATAPARIHFAFVDGKHTGESVRMEAMLIADRQSAGDVIVFDDVHIPEVRKAALHAAHEYNTETVGVLPKRAYMICRKRR